MDINNTIQQLIITAPPFLFALTFHELAHGYTAWKLDGSKVLMGFLPPELAANYARWEPYGFIVLLVLFYLGVIGQVIMPIISFIVRLLVQ